MGRCCAVVLWMSECPCCPDDRKMLYAEAYSVWMNSLLSGNSDLQGDSGKSELSCPKRACKKCLAGICTAAVRCLHKWQVGAMEGV